MKNEKKRKKERNQKSRIQILPRRRPLWLMCLWKKWEEKSFLRRWRKKIASRCNFLFFVFLTSFFFHSHLCASERESESVEWVILWRHCMGSCLIWEVIFGLIQDFWKRSLSTHSRRLPNSSFHGHKVVGRPLVKAFLISYCLVALKGFFFFLLSSSFFVSCSFVLLFFFCSFSSSWQGFLRRDEPAV